MATVLIVDDNAIDRLVIRKMLEQHGHRVIEASDGQEVEGKVDEFAPDIILLDIIMREQEGMTTVMEVKRNFPGLPIIAITGAEESYYLEAMIGLGADYGFRKPPDGERLNAKIVELTGSPD
jgi:CheY-like chemotaxis protein